MAIKNYCIIKRGDYYYIPVKARYSPYPGHESEEAYLACLPNFFGGAMEAWETIYEGLAREVREESARKINITSVDLEYSRMERLYQFRQYNFYLVKLADRSEYFKGTICLLDEEAGDDPAEKEMSCILKVSVNNDLGGKDVDAFLELCKDLGGDCVD